MRGFQGVIAFAILIVLQRIDLELTNAFLVTVGKSRIDLAFFVSVICHIRGAFGRESWGEILRERDRESNSSLGFFATPNLLMS